MTINKVIIFLVPLLVFFVALVVALATPKGTATRRFAMKAAVRISCFLLGMGLHAMLYQFPFIIWISAGTALIVFCLTSGKKASSRKWLRPPMTYTYTVCGVMGFYTLFSNHTGAAGIAMSLLLLFIIVMYDSEPMLNLFQRLILRHRNGPFR